MSAIQPVDENKGVNEIALLMIIRDYPSFIDYNYNGKYKI